MQWHINVSGKDQHDPREFVVGASAVRIGRAKEVEIRLAAADISRVHCTLSRVGRRVQIRDSSRNGTFVREGTKWVRVHGESEVELPVTLRAGAWTLDVAAQPAAVSAMVELADAAATWEQSVLLRSSDLPTVHEAIMVFDLCESSLIANQDDHMAFHLKQRLMQIAEPVLEYFGRRFFKNTGDGFLATFHEPAAALDAAIALEQRIQQRNQRTSNEAIHYRVALHYGAVWTLDAGGDDIHGNDVNIAFRIEGVKADDFAGAVSSLPRRDRILCSRAFLSAVSGDRLNGVLSGHVVCGEAQLKGISERVTIHWLRTPYSRG